MSADVVYRIIQLLGAAAAFLLAAQSYQRRSVRLGEEPTLPRYFTRQTLGVVGVACYGVFIALLFLALISVWMSLRPLVQAVVDNAASGSLAGLFSSLTGRILMPLIGAAVFLFLIGWESRFNPILILRDTVFDLFAVPRKVIEVYNVLRSSRLAEVDAELRQHAMDRLLVPSLDSGDFDKASNTVEYEWARNCVLFDQIQAYAADPSYRRFFREPSLKWGEICISFNEVSEKVANWKQAEPHYTKTLDILGELERLTALLCRLLACLVVFGSADDLDMWRAVARLGGDMRHARLKHTYKYMSIFAGAVASAVLLGRELAVVLHNNFFDPANPLGHFEFDTLRWVLYAVVLYVLPIGLVFAARVKAYREVSADTSRYYGFYLGMALVGYVVATSVTALIVGLGLNAETFNFLESFVWSMRWGIMPALLSGYVAFQMDNPVPESEGLAHMWTAGLTRAAAWALIGLIITLYATDNLAVDQSGLRFAVVVTTASISGFVGLVARFKTIQIQL